MADCGPGKEAVGRIAKAETARLTEELIFCAQACLSGLNLYASFPRRSDSIRTSFVASDSARQKRDKLLDSLGAPPSVAATDTFSSNHQFRGTREAGDGASVSKRAEDARPADAPAPAAHCTDSSRSLDSHCQLRKVRERSKTALGSLKPSLYQQHFYTLQWGSQ